MTELQEAYVQLKKWRKQLERGKSKKPGALARINALTVALGAMVSISGSLDAEDQIRDNPRGTSIPVFSIFPTEMHAFVSAAGTEALHTKTTHEQYLKLEGEFKRKVEALILKQREDD